MSEPFMQTMFFEILHRRLILVHSNQPPSTQEWSEWVDFIEKAVKEGRVEGLLVLTESVGPNARQRKLLSDMWSRTPMPPIAVVTPSAAARAIVTALNFFSQRPLRTFHPGERQGAFEYIGLHDFDEAEDVLQRIRRLVRDRERKAS